MGREAPPLADPGPELELGLEPYWNAFWALSGDRQIGAMGGVGPIPFTALERWAARHGIADADDFEELERFVRALDGEYIRWAAAETEKRLKAARPAKAR
jgi:hypothetical protein